MTKTVDQVADHISDIFIEKMADGFVDSLKGFGEKAMGGLKSTGNYLVNKGNGTLHSALGGNDAAHWGALGALGVGGLGAAKGLISPDEGKGRVRSMLSNAALGALMGGAGGVSAGMAVGDNPAIGGGNVRGGPREQQDKLQGNLNRANAKLELNQARAGLGPVGAAVNALGNYESTGIVDAGATAGKELLNPLKETADISNYRSTAGAALGAQALRRRVQLGRIDSATTPDIKIGPQGWRKLNPFGGSLDVPGHIYGEATATSHISDRALQDAANKVLANAKAPPVSSAPGPITPPVMGSSLNTANMPSMPKTPGAATTPSHNIQDIIKELESTLGHSGKDKSTILPAGFNESRVNAFNSLVNDPSGKGVSMIDDAIRNRKGFDFKFRAPLGGTRFGLIGSQIGGQLAASQLRHLPESIQNIRNMDNSSPTNPGEVQVAEQALQKFLADRAARGGK